MCNCRCEERLDAREAAEREANERMRKVTEESLAAMHQACEEMRTSIDSRREKHEADRDRIDLMAAQVERMQERRSAQEHVRAWVARERASGALATLATEAIYHRRPWYRRWF